MVLFSQCKEDGISTVGAKEALAKRHQRFSLLWNAERYSISPRTPSELADLFSAREKNFERVKLFSGKEKKDSVALKNYLKSGESGDPYFDAKFGGKFGELIAQGKATMQARKAKNDAADTAGVVVSSNSISQPSHSAQEQNTQALSDHSGEAGAAFLSKTSNEVQMAKLGTVLDNHTSKEESQDDSIVTNNQGAKRLAPIDLVEEDAAIPKIAAGRPYHQSETSKGETSIVSDKSRAKRKHDSQAIALSRPKRERQPITSSWTCSKCTFYNEKHMWKSARCEMCNTQRTEL